jgi:hypothetical protein
VLASYPDTETVKAGIPVSRGAAKVFDLLHSLAVNAARSRGYTVRPGSVTLHIPASLVALGVSYTSRHLRRLLPELEEVGLIACGPHASKVKDMSLWDGYLWSVKLSPGEGIPRLRREEWKHQWRNFAQDIEAGRTVKALLERMSSLHDPQKKEAVNTALQDFAVNPYSALAPVVSSADMAGADSPNAVQDMRELGYRLGELVNLPAEKRAEGVGRMASALSHSLGDFHSRRWYCSLIWQSLAAEQEGRGGLGILAAALTRLEVDRKEWKELRNPAALLTFRLRRESVPA